MKIAVVNLGDEVVSYIEKQEVHERGLLHRAFSLFIFNSRGEILLHQRAMDKYHSAGLWTNTCCSHLPENADFLPFMHERLQDEMGIDCELHPAFRFHYQISFENGLIENEIDHVFVGLSDTDPQANPTEVQAWQWLSISDIQQQIADSPQRFSYWFKQVMLRITELEAKLTILKHAVVVNS